MRERIRQDSDHTCPSCEGTLALSQKTCNNLLCKGGGATGIAWQASIKIRSEFWREYTK